LAIEVNPDEMAAYFVNQLFDQVENEKKLQDILNQHYFDRNRNALAKKFNKPAEENGCLSVQYRRAGRSNNEGATAPAVNAAKITKWREGNYF
jgi:hypothetical protein